MGRTPYLIFLKTYLALEKQQFIEISGNSMEYRMGCPYVDSNLGEKKQLPTLEAVACIYHV